MEAQSLDHLPATEIIPGFHGKFLHGEKSSLVFWEVEQGSSFPLHQHPHEQITFIISGEFEMIIDGKIHLLRDRETMVIPSGISHSGKALKACQIMDIFSPVREDYRSIPPVHVEKLMRE
ncbi:MAG: cupin domain-containing protein [Chitinophagaceae bacterium]